METQDPINPYAAPSVADSPATPTPPPPPSSMDGAYNPYAPPSADVSFTSGEGDAADELTRRQLLRHEASIRTVGTLHYVSFVGLALVTVGLTAAVVMSGQAEMFSSILSILALAAFTMFFYYVASGLRKLNPSVKIWATLISCFGLLGFPLGTLFNLYILWLLHSDKGKRVLTAEYQAIVARTPHIKYQTAWWLWAILITFGIIFVVLMVVGMMRP